MERDDIIQLSEDIGATDHLKELISNIKTDMYLLVGAGSKTSLKPVLSQLRASHYTYWRKNVANHVEYHKALIADKETATLAKMWCESGQSVRPLVLGELNQARNEIAIPWLPGIVGFQDDRDFNRALNAIDHRISYARLQARDLHLTDVTDLIDQLSGALRAHRRETIKFDASRLFTG
jgi:hypothetical protein